MRISLAGSQAESSTIKPVIPTQRDRKESVSRYRIDLLPPKTEDTSQKAMRYRSSTSYSQALQTSELILSLNLEEIFTSFLD